MEICKNGAMRQDFEVIRRSDGMRMAVVYTTTDKQAVSWYLTAMRLPRHEGEKAKYVAKSVSSDIEREQFVRCQEPAKQRAYYRHYKMLPPPPIVIDWDAH